MNLVSCSSRATLVHMSAPGFSVMTTSPCTEPPSHGRDTILSKNRGTTWFFTTDYNQIMASLMGKMMTKHDKTGGFGSTQFSDTNWDGLNQHFQLLLHAPANTWMCKNGRSNLTMVIGAAGKSRISDLGSRISDLESRISDLGSRISDLGSRISDLGSRISDLGSRISDLESRISDLGSRISNLGSRISNLESRILNTNLESQISYLVSRILDRESRISEVGF